MIISGIWTPRNGRSDSWVIQTGLDRLDSLILMLPLDIQNELNLHYSNPLTDHEVFYSMSKSFDTENFPTSVVFLVLIVIM